MNAGTRRLSVAMIVRDAAAGLRETLQCVAPHADELVVLDTGSRDQTLAVARELGAKAAAFRWNDDFAAARNAALANVSGDFVLWLDAGETLTADDASAVAKFAKEAADPQRAYMLLVQIPPLASHGSIEQVGRLRLIPRRPGVSFFGRVGERVEPSLQRLGIAVEGLPWRIQRTAREHDPARKLAVAERNQRLAERELRERGRQFRPLLIQGESLAALGRKREARTALEGALSLAPPQSTELLEVYYALLTALDGEPDALTKQTTLALKGLESFPVDAQLLCALGHYMQSQQRLELASRSFQLAYRHGRINPWLWHLADIHEVAAACQAATLRARGEEQQAVSWLNETLAQHPASLRLRRLLLQTYIQQGRRAEALAQVDLLPPYVTGRDMLRTAVRGACLAAAQNWPAAENYLQTAYQGGCRDAICLKAYALTLWGLGRLPQAKQVLDQWRQLDPHDAEPTKLLAALVGPLADPPARNVRIDAPTDAPRSMAPPAGWPAAAVAAPPRR